jgi:hypothetical protein
MASRPKSHDLDPSSFLWEGVVQRVYIHTTGSFRLLARVQFPERLACTLEEKTSALTTRFWWQLQRSSCWEPHARHVELEGTYHDLHAVLRNGREVVLYLPAMEWMAGEYLQLSVTTPSEDVVLRAVQCQLFHEVCSQLFLERFRFVHTDITLCLLQVANWERPSAVPSLNFAA